MDTNHDGKISFEEFYNFHLEKNGLDIVSVLHEEVKIVNLVTVGDMSASEFIPSPFDMN